MKKIYVLILLLSLNLLTACQKDIPEPETKENSLSFTRKVQASGLNLNEKDPFIVKYHVKGNDVYIECVASSVSFRNNDGKITLSIDGKKSAEYRQAAFIIKGLPTGTHQLKLELRKQHEQAAVATKVMNISIK